MCETSTGAPSGPTDGVCGSAGSTPTSSAPTTNLCAAGTPSSVEGSSDGPWSWNCYGIGTGSTDVLCSATEGAVNGVCGAANGGTTNTAPSGNNLCSAGTATSVFDESGDGSGPWSWACMGSDNTTPLGATVGCEALGPNSGGAINHKGTQNDNDMDGIWAGNVAGQDAQYAAWQAAGIAWGRANVGGWALDPSCSGPDFGQVNQSLTEANKHGINILIMLNGPANCQALTPNCSESPPADNQTYIDEFITPLAKDVASQTTPGGKHYYEVWNEPIVNWSNWTGCGGTEASFADWYKRAYTAIHTNDPNAVFVGCGSCNYPPLSAGITDDDLAWMSADGVLNGCNGGPCFDALSLHPYPSCGPSGWGSDALNCTPHWASMFTNNAYSGYQSFQSELASYGLGNTQIWVTEVGCGPTMAADGGPWDQCTCAQQTQMYNNIFNVPANRFPNEGPIITFDWSGGGGYDITQCPSTISTLTNTSGVW